MKQIVFDYSGVITYKVRQITRKREKGKKISKFELDQALNGNFAPSVLDTRTKNPKLVLGRSLPLFVGVKLAPLRAKITNRNSRQSKSARCNGKSCLVCQYIVETCKFEDADGNKYDIRKGVINCNTEFTVYKFYGSSCSK